MEEIEREVFAEIDGRRFALRYWAINYGTHVGSTIKIFDAATGVSVFELSFETHWNAAGRYILRIGAVKGNENWPHSAEMILRAGANVLKKLSDIFAAATSLDDCFNRVKANANALLWEAGAALVHPFAAK